jgi:hypothetical protein
MNYTPARQHAEQYQTVFLRYVALQTYRQYTGQQVAAEQEVLRTLGPTGALHVVVAKSRSQTLLVIHLTTISSPSFFTTFFSLR